MNVRELKKKFSELKSLSNLDFIKKLNKNIKKNISKNIENNLKKVQNNLQKQESSKENSSVINLNYSSTSENGNNWGEDLSSKERDFFKNYQSDEKIKDLLKELFPIKKIKVQDKTFYLSKVFNFGRYNSDIIYYIEKDNTIYYNIYYKSKSSGVWRCSPGGILFVDGEMSFYKSLNYSITTKPIIEIELLLNDLEKSKLDKSIDTKLYTKSLSEEIEEILKSKNGIFQEDKFLDFFKTNGFLSKKPANFRGISIKRYIQILEKSDVYNKYSFFFPQDYENPLHKYRVSHEILGQIEIVQYETQLVGEKIIFEIAYSLENKEIVWINNIYIKNSPINKYGLRIKNLNPGSLVEKPIEYDDQLVQEDLRESKKIDGYKEYVLITPILSKLKPIQEFKKKYLGIN